MKAASIIRGCGAVALFLPTLMWAAAPTTISYQGQLKAGGALFTGTATMKFAVVDGAVSLWSNDGTSVGGAEPTGSVSVTVSSGVFAVQLGAPPMIALPPSTFAVVTSPVLRVWVNTGSGFELLTDQPFSSVPFALQGAASGGGWVQSGSNVYFLGGNAGVGTNNPSYPLSVVGPGTEDQIFDVKDGNMRLQNINPRLFITDNLGTGYVGTDNSGTIVVAPLQQARLYVGPSEVKVSGADLAVQKQNPRIYIGDNVGWSYIGTDNAGNIVANPVASRFEVQGTTRTEVIEITGGDVAERFTVDEDAEPGTVLAIDPESPGHLEVCREGMSRLVAGVVSGAGGQHAGVVLSGGPTHSGGAAVAMSGRVWVKGDATRRPIRVGDLLVSATRPGHAMATGNPSKAAGRIIGKAMSALEAGTGLVLVLVSLQ